MPHPIPNIPGQILQDPITTQQLALRLAELCGLKNAKFPGAQPVSFTAASLDLLESKDFWVCEKSDGVRVLVFVVMNGMSGSQEVWLVDRKQRFFLVENLHFPHWERPDDPLTDTVLDGELVIDINPKTGAETLRFYAFDCLVVAGENIMKKPLIKRFARLREWVINPYERALRDIPEWRESLPFEVLAKKQELSYHIAQVLNVHVPQLQHGHDGLIFTCAESEYVPGTDDKILKWKPPSENSIDFKLELRFPPLASHPDEPDYTAKPAFLLNIWLGKNDYEYFDYMDVDDDEWESMKQSGEQYDDRIIEVAWDTDRDTWKLLRIRDDKPDGNHKSIVDKILVSIRDGVEIEALLTRSDQIRSAWKAREAALRSGSGKQPAPIQTQGQPPAKRPAQANMVGAGPMQHPVTPGGALRGAGSGGGGGGGYPPTPGGGGAMPSNQGVLTGLKR